MRSKYVTIRAASAVGVAERWRSQYQHPKDGWHGTAYRNDGKQVYDELISLGPNPPIDKVAEIVGNKSWSYISCDGCNEYIERAVELGEDEPKTYCATCIEEARQILTGENK
jgi:hypothetical protein